MGFFDIFSAGGVAKQVMKGAGRVADALHYSKEEKNKFLLKVGEIVKDESSIRSITRRIIAFTVGGVWLEATQMMLFSAFWYPDAYDRLEKIYVYICGVFGAVIAFYFYKYVKQPKLK